MSSSDSNHAGWYLASGGFEGGPSQSLAHSQYFQPRTNQSTQGDGGTNQSLSNHHHCSSNQHQGLQHAAQQGGYYDHHYHPSVDGSGEVPEEFSPPEPGRRDQFPSYHYQGQRHATPLQPPPHMYNGPPVSALVPRFPRGPATIYTQGFTPNHQYEHNKGNRRISFPHSLPPSYPPPRSDAGITKSRTATKDDRRTSFGFPTISTCSQFMIPTPLQHDDQVQANRDDGESPPAVPLPPSEKPLKKNEPRNSDRPTVSESIANPLQESRRMNLLSKKFEPEAHSDEDKTLKDPISYQPKKKPTFQDASLLLGLRTDSNMTSPATVPEMQEENDSVDTNSTLKVHSTSSATAVLPKTCFPTKVPDKYPKRLSLPNDSIKLNALHCFVRTELLEIFVVEPSSENLKFRHAPSSSVGRVGLRCVHCTMARNNSMNASRDDEAPMAVFYPKSVNEIYRLVTSWQRCHVRKCKSLPPGVRATWNGLRATEKSRGKTVYWVESAKQIGLVDCPSRAGGVRFELPDDGEMNGNDDKVDMTNTENNEPTNEMVSQVTFPLQQMNKV